jgi:hypothetical protein
MASTTPLRPIAVIRPTRSPRPIQLTIARGPGSGARHSNAFASNHSGSSPLAKRVLGHSFGFGQHLAASGGRRERVAPIMSMDLRRRLHRSPFEAPRTTPIDSWPWSAPPSVAIPSRHEQFVGRAVLPEASGWEQPAFDSGGFSVAAAMFSTGGATFDEVDVSSGFDWADTGASLPFKPMDQPAISRTVRQPSPGLAGIRPIARRATTPDLLLSVPHLANHVVADHVAVQSTSPDILARQIARSEHRLSQGQPPAVADSHERVYARRTATENSFLVTDPAGTRESRATSNMPSGARHWTSVESPTNFTLDLLRHLQWSPAHQSQSSIPERTINTPHDEAISVGSDPRFDPSLPVGPSLDWSGTTQGTVVARTMQVSPVATPLVASLPPGTLSAPMMSTTWQSSTESSFASPRSRIESASAPGLPFVGQRTETATSPLIPPFVAARLAQVSRLISPEGVLSAQSHAREDGVMSTERGVAGSAASSSPITATSALPDLPVVAQRAAFAVRHAQQALDGPTSPVWGSLGRQVQVEQATPPIAPASSQTRPAAAMALSPWSLPVMSQAPLAQSFSSAVGIQRSWSAGVPSSAPAGADPHRGSADVWSGPAVSRLPLASPRPIFASGSAIVGTPFPGVPFVPSAPFFPRTALPDLPTTRSIPSSALVFRSPLVDRAEPDLPQQAEAGDLMSASTGAPLPTVIRRSMEQRLGMDLASVRVHSGPRVMRAANLMAARAMAHGSDVFMPGGMPESPTSPDIPLLAHELTHVAHQQGHRPPTPMSVVRPLTLARRTSDQEQQANQIERSFLDTARGLGQSAIPESLKNPALTLPKLAQSGMQQAKDAVGSGVQQAKDALTDAAAPVTSVVSALTSATPGASAGPSAAELADQVYHLLERRLMVERERGGYRR